MGNDVIDGIASFKTMSSARKMAFQVVARSLADEQVVEMRSIFERIDQNSDGMITLDELKTQVERSGRLDIEDVESVWHQLDVDGSGYLDYSEFLAMLICRNGDPKETDVREAFLLVDK